MGTESKNIQTQKRQKKEIKIKKKSNLISIKTVKPKKMISHSIQTETEENVQSAEIVNNSKEIKQRPRSLMPPLKPSKLVIKMEKRALERREKREKLMELKKTKEQKYKALMLKQKQMEIDKVRELKRLEKEKKIQKLQKQRRLKEIESN